MKRNWSSLSVVPTLAALALISGFGPNPSRVRGVDRNALQVSRTKPPKPPTPNDPPKPKPKPGDRDGLVDDRSLLARSV